MEQKPKKERAWKFWLLLVLDIIIFVSGLSNAFEGFIEKAWLKMSIGIVAALLSLYLFSKSIDPEYGWK
jgi:hypothetical protein